MKTLKPLVAASSVLMCLAAVTGCNNQTSNTKTTSVIEEAEKMTYQELVAKAKEEIGDNTLQTYGNSSQLEKALEAFTAETGIKTQNTKKGDAETYTELGEAFKTKKYVADMVLLQDGNKLQNEMLNLKYLDNYIPKDQKENIAEDDQEPAAAIYLNKIFMYNNTDFDGTNGETATAGKLTHYMTNVWQVAGSASDEGHISSPSFKSPSTENVNMNFLVMLTSDAWVKKLEIAYKDFYGKDYVKEDTYENIGYKWIAEFLKNTQPHTSDGTACKDVAKGQKGSMALVNFNKNKDLKDTGAGKEDKANLSYPAIEEGDNLKGFGGFCYKMYALIADNARYPYAACAFTNYLLSAEGFNAAWGAKDGYYSVNKKAGIAETDKELSWWKERLVIEDPKYVSSKYSDVFQFIQQYEGK
mgnify:CR=1 FL=1